MLKPSISNKRSIAVIAHDCLNGGSVGAVAWRHILLLSESYRVFVLTRGLPHERPDDVVHLSITHREFGFLRRFAHVPNELSFQYGARQVLDTLAATTPLEAVWCHSHATAALAAAPLTTRTDTRLILTTHGDIFHRPPGSYDPLLTRYYRAVTPAAYRHADVIQALSPYMRDAIAENTQETAKIITLPNGIQPADIGLDAIAWRTPSDFDRGSPLRLLFAGSLLPIKGVEYLLHALAAMKPGPDDLQLQCVGDGPQKIELQALTDRLGIDHLVEFTGAIARSNMGKRFRDAHALVVPSISDALPTVVLEGFAAGLPAIGSDTGGIPAMIGTTRGLLFEAGSAPSIVRVLQRILNDRASLHDMSRACSQAAMQTYAWDTLGPRLREFVTPTKVTLPAESVGLQQSESV